MAWYSHLPKYIKEFHAITWGTYPEPSDYLVFWQPVWKNTYYRTGVCFHWSEI